ncbi:carbohydrate ABC transporter permease [Leifsonia sp. NPDC058194]|uniref:carbohydrate ABC transporter permease n=1 Tax=Leifsonia sp. NPDC058194 TaxID=3346374 RepID=UPI0036D76532
MRTRFVRVLSQWWRELAMMLVALLWWIPFYFLINIALRPSSELLEPAIKPPSSLDFSNFASAWQGTAGLPISSSMLSSLIVTVASVLILIVIGSACAYTISRRRGALGNVLYLIFAIGIILPFQLGIVPVYSAFRELGLVGNFAGMILLEVGLQLPLVVFLYTGFARALPRDYEEAARMDGASQPRVFFSIVFPLLRPITGTVAILASISIWNDFFNPLIFLGGTDNATLPLAIYSFVGEFTSQWNLIFAAVIIALIPMLAFFIIAQRQMVKGFAGGLKG